MASRSFRFTQADLDDLAELAALKRATEAEALRQAIRNDLRREKRKGAE